MRDAGAGGYSTDQEPVIKGYTVPARKTGDTVMDEFSRASTQEARPGLAESGILIGVVLVLAGKISWRGREGGLIKKI